MVEGPGATRNAQKLQAAVGCIVIPSSCSFASEKQQQSVACNPPDTITSPSFHEGGTLIEAFSIGKELFMIISKSGNTDCNKSDIHSDCYAVRLHFGMNGSLSVSRKQLQGQQNSNPSYKRYNRQAPDNRQAPSLKLTLQEQRQDEPHTNNCGKKRFLLECYGTTVSQVSVKVAESKRIRLQCLDVCNNQTATTSNHPFLKTGTVNNTNAFDREAVRKALRTRPQAMISDALLDQNRFPGVGTYEKEASFFFEVAITAHPYTIHQYSLYHCYLLRVGNIIKMEGLHRARIHPKRSVENLADEELLCLIDACRVYAMGWLRSGRSPTKKVYNETNCQTCHSIGSVRMVKLGNDLSRVTFWCESCQPLQPGDASSTAGRGVLTASSTRYNHNNPHKDANPSSSQNKNIHSAMSTAIKNACPQHGARCFRIQRVRHKEQNKHRLFGSCRVPGCPYFAWADAHLPTCPTCHQKCILRVSKTERSSGRWFLSCPKSDSNATGKGINQRGPACKGMFAWATQQHLEPLGKFLTPLL